MKRFYNPSFLRLIFLRSLTVLFAIVGYCVHLSAQTVTIAPAADAYVRDGNYSDNNYGNDTSLIVKGSPFAGFTRYSYVKFSLPALSKIGSARLKIFGLSTNNSSSINISVFGVADDSWTEAGITFKNAPPVATGLLGSTEVGSVPDYYEFDVTGFVISNLNSDKIVTLVLEDIGDKDNNIIFNSKENGVNEPALIIDTTFAYTPGASTTHPMLFVENPDKFPSNDHFVFSRIQIPWTRDSIYNSNHDSLKVRIHNNGLDPLVVNSLSISDTTLWKIDKMNGRDYDPAIQLPSIISSGSSVDVMVKFVAEDLASRAKVANATLTIVSDDDRYPVKTVYLKGLWQHSGEGVQEPYSQEVFTTFGYKTDIGFGGKDPDQGDSTKLKGDEIKPSYFVRADTTRPVSIRQLAAYHNCCHSVETFKWFYKGTTEYNSVFPQIGLDGQSLLPRRSTSSTYYPSAGTISPKGPFGVYIGVGNTTDPSINPGKKLGVRVYLAIDSLSYVIPNSYLLTNDYLGTTSTNFDYNDNIYYISNVKPYIGTAYNSPLKPTPSDLDFGERLVDTNISMQLTLSSRGETYTDGTQDPPITITSLAITGENKSDFTASMPAKTTLGPQETTTMQVTFKPATQGLKIADLLIYTSNSSIPKRVPLYGIAKRPGVVVTAHYRVNSGSPVPLVINGQTWSADDHYSFNNLEPYTNPALKEIEGTDDDSLYFYEQSSDANKRPFRYEFPVDTGTYYVRLHFAEIYWGAPGSGFEGGEGSRVFHVKLENKYAVINEDLVQDVGEATAVIKNLPVKVTDETLNVDFSATVNRPSVSAIEVYSFSPDSIVVSPGPGDTTGAPGDMPGRPRLYPNPATPYSVTVQYPESYKGSHDLLLIDVLGRKCMKSTIILSGGNNIGKIDYSKLSLSPGIYFLKITDLNNKSDVLKLVIN